MDDERILDTSARNSWSQEANLGKVCVCKVDGVAVFGVQHEERIEKNAN